MEESLKIREMYDKRASAYDSLLKKWRYHYTVRKILGSIDIDISKNARILDIGCGTGLATEILSSRFANAKLTGLDYSEEMLYLYKERFPRVEIISGDFNGGKIFYRFDDRKKVKLNNRSFDLVVSTGAVSEYGKKDVVIPLIYRLLHDGGIFVNIGIRKNIMSAMTGKVWKYKPMGRKELIDACEKNGFSDIEEVKLSWDHFPSNITKFVLKAVK